VAAANLCMRLYDGRYLDEALTGEEMEDMFEGFRSSLSEGSHQEFRNLLVQLTLEKVIGLKAEWESVRKVRTCSTPSSIWVLGLIACLGIGKAQ
jgi:hypothetical protein